MESSGDALVYFSNRTCLCFLETFLFSSQKASSLHVMKVLHASARSLFRRHQPVKEPDLSLSQSSPDVSEWELCFVSISGWNTSCRLQVSFKSSRTPGLVKVNSFQSVWRRMCEDSQSSEVKKPFERGETSSGNRSKSRCLRVKLLERFYKTTLSPTIGWQWHEHWFWTETCKKNRVKMLLCIKDLIKNLQIKKRQDKLILVICCNIHFQ